MLKDTEIQKPLGKMRAKGKQKCWKQKHNFVYSSQLLAEQQKLLLKGKINNSNNLSVESWEKEISKITS